MYCTNPIRRISCLAPNAKNTKYVKSSPRDQDYKTCKGKIYKTKTMRLQNSQACPSYFSLKAKDTKTTRHAKAKLAKSSFLNTKITKPTKFMYYNSTIDKGHARQNQRGTKS